jgi:hypothetical protein
MIELEVVHAGTEAATRRVMADLLGTVGVRPTKSDFTTGPFVDEVNELYCKGLRPKECSLAGKSPSGEFPRAAFFAKSNLARGPWPRDGEGAAGRDGKAAAGPHADPTISPRLTRPAS